MRFYLFDRIDEICEWKTIRAVKCITLADDVFNEHFPGYPIFPGTLMIEGLAQLGGSFFEIAMTRQNLPIKRAVLSIVREFKIKKPARPGDRLIYTAEIVTMQENYGVSKVSATLDGELCAAGELLFTFMALPDEKIRESREALYAIVTTETRFTKHEDRV